MRTSFKRPGVKKELYHAGYFKIEDEVEAGKTSLFDCFSAHNS